MSKRSEILDGMYIATENYGLVYTEVLGWVDLGHAQGKDIKKLLDDLEQGERSGCNYYNVTYSQGMTAPYGLIRSGKMLTWRIKRGRPFWERKSIALAMMMTVARSFEDFQGSFPNSLVTSSGNSAEDLVSDLLGFYRVASNPDLINMLRPVSKAEALKRWDHYGEIGLWKNKDFTPLLFPDPEKHPNTHPKKSVLPSFLRTIEPYNDFLSG